MVNGAGLNVNQSFTRRQKLVLSSHTSFWKEHSKFVRFRRIEQAETCSELIKIGPLTARVAVATIETLPLKYGRQGGEEVGK